VSNSYTTHIAFAQEYIAAKYIAPKRILSRPEQQVIAIHELLSDGEWHTAKAISQYIGVKSTRHVNNMMQVLKKPLLIASGQNGYCIPQKHTILIVGFNNSSATHQNTS
jgi:hypothetical protein